MPERKCSVMFADLNPLLAVGFFILVMTPHTDLRFLVSHILSTQAGAAVSGSASSSSWANHGNDLPPPTFLFVLVFFFSSIKSSVAVS